MMRLPLALVAVLLCAACAPRTFQELNVPAGAGAGYGYSEQRLDERRFVVTYNAPVQTGFSFAGEAGREEAERQINRAYEFALARAAELALANGYPAFRVEDRRNDAMSQNYEAWQGPFYRMDRNYAMDDASLTARVTVVVALLPALESGAYDAQGTLATIRGRYTPPS
jgi:hypothetical protein